MAHKPHVRRRDAFTDPERSRDLMRASGAPKGKGWKDAPRTVKHQSVNVVKAGDGWQVKVTHYNGATSAKTFATKDAADAFAAKERAFRTTI